MTAPARRVEIEATPAGHGSSMTLRLLDKSKGEGDTLHTSAAYGTTQVMLFVHDAPAAREYAQMLRGAADALVEYAVAQETATRLDDAVGRIVERVPWYQDGVPAGLDATGERK